MAATDTTPPNILLILVDQLRYPQRKGGGIKLQIEDILSFLASPEGNPYAVHFPGFCKLQEYAVVFADHTIAESACIPSRASLMTGQYGPRTGVTQTDGLFKSGDATNFPWLKADGVPTMGDWFRQLGYTTHYFGKWHVSNPPEHTLQGFGFSDWELSWPEPHGSLVNNLGAYRDFQFADLACQFLRARALGVPYDRQSSQQAQVDPTSSAKPDIKPFFAVASFTNPHDIATYPTLPRMLKPATWDPTTQTWVPQTPLIDRSGPVPIPDKGTYSGTPKGGTFRIALNPTGLPQACADASDTQDEDLLQNKPRAQYDASLKVGLGLASKTGLALGQAIVGLGDKIRGETEADRRLVLKRALEQTFKIPIPFPIQPDPDGDTTGFLQYYVYAISLVDQHILRVLGTLEESGLRDNTLVVFAADHGEMGGAHGMMMEKWHVAYQETVAVPVVFSWPALNANKNSPVPFVAQTSHIDILPTLLGFATNGDTSALQTALTQLAIDHNAAPLPGADLSAMIQAQDNVRGQGPVVGPDGRERKGVLFATDDMITEPLPRDADPHNISSWQQYGVFAAAVDALRNGTDGAPVQTPSLTPGPVTQPAHVRALRSGPWKLVRYCDPWSERPVPDEWELYNLSVDPTERINLVTYDSNPPTPIPTLPDGLDTDAVNNALAELLPELRRQEAELLSPWPAAHPSAGLLGLSPGRTS